MHYTVRCIIGREEKRRSTDGRKWRFLAKKDEKLHNLSIYKGKNGNNTGDIKI